MARGDVPGWHLRGELLGSCNCDWGCPCNFDAPPTYGHCDGFYAIAIRDGVFGSVRLDGVRFLMGGHSPGPIHEGGGTSVLILDEAATGEQRAAVETLWRGGGVGSPFDEFASVTSAWLDPIVAPIAINLDGIRSTVTVAGGRVYELATSRVRNPVTGEEEEVHLDKPTGFTSTRSELGRSTVSRFVSDGLAFDVSGRYAEYAEFDYAGP